MVDWTSLIIGGVGAITGISSLIWHTLNSRSKVILERVSFTRTDRHTHKEAIDIEAIIRNRSNRATTIEEVCLIFGNHWIPRDNQQPIKVEPNSSYSLRLTQHFSLDEFKEILNEGEIEVGIHITHTFGVLKKAGSTDFSTPWLTLQNP